MSRDIRSVDFRLRAKAHVTGATVPANRAGYPATSMLLIGVAVFGLLWLLNIPYRQIYQPSNDDVTALADGLLLVPGARWTDWFTQGHSHFFDAYPEWPWGRTAFARPAFQLLIYLAHFLLGREWSSYLSINYLGVAGVVVCAFTIARTALGTSTWAALLAAALVLSSPPVLESSIWDVGLASELAASVLIGSSFLAVVARRDLLCLSLLMIAMLTKETAVWAPFAAALTALLRPSVGETVSRRAFLAAVMLVPLVFWLVLRFTFFGGIGDTYATAQYTPIIGLVGMLAQKLTHLQDLLVSRTAFDDQGRWAMPDRAIRFGTALLILVLLLQWALGTLRAASDRLLPAVRERRCPTVDSALLQTLWAVIALAFYLALALSNSRYSAAAVMFVWPAVVGELSRRHNAALRVVLAVCGVLSLGRTSHAMAELNPPSEQSYEGRELHAIAAMNAALREMPPSVEEVYVVTAGGLVEAAPEYLRALLGLRASIVRVIDVYSSCPQDERVVSFDHSTADGVVTLKIVVPECGFLFFFQAESGSAAIVDGRVRRGESIDYELPEAYQIDQGPLKPPLRPGRRMIAHIRIQGLARFIIEKGGPAGELVWFETH